MSTRDPTIGRARTILVLQSDSTGRAVVSAVTARVGRGNGRKRVTVRGPARFDPDVIRHIEEVLVPLVDRILERLDPKAKPRSFELSAVNLSAASAADVGLAITGFSADAAIVLALLSAALKIPIAQDVVTTGHIASCDGDIRAVAGLPAKLAAAIEDGGIRQVICPAIEGDGSLRMLSPAEAELAAGAIADARSQIRVVEIEDVCRLIQTVWGDEVIVAASLRCEFFGPERPSSGGESIIDKTADHFDRGNEARFWQVLETWLQEGRSAAARELLISRLKLQVSRRQYPAGFGRRLFELMLSVPPTVRRLKLTFPLVPLDACFPLACLAVSNDLTDPRYLLDAVMGRFGSQSDPVEPAAKPIKAKAAASAVVRAVLSELDHQTLAQKIGLPIDVARSRYVLDEVVTESYDVFNETVCSFYLRVVRHIGAAPAFANAEMVAAQAHALLERTFAEEGGVAAAWVEARTGIRGGLRYVLDQVTARLKADELSRHVSRVAMLAVDPLDWSGRVEFIRAFMKYLGPQLPAELRAQPPERFAPRYDTILQAYVRSIDRMKDLLRTL